MEVEHSGVDTTTVIPEVRVLREGRLTSTPCCLSADMMVDRRSTSEITSWRQKS